MNAIDVRGILERAGASPDAPDGSQGWALAQVEIVHDELVAALRRAVEAAEARMPHATFLSDARAALAKAGAA